ncbi:very short patch repair endonuclease [Mucilaginibacter sp. NFR10]|uniref:very short patch repair endonuclease n=1 Tax=Mucilaginibacter sp. NFR10 TaxID=1566292 RepID=UPI000B8408AA|nr:very short patch repair endonuclease [Mucilaginibacter sp. NFR10]
MTTADTTLIKVPQFSSENGFSTTQQRSRHMAKIKGKNTKPELTFRKALWQLGIRYRKHLKSLPGTPDITILKHKIVIFIDGEFWHGYNWEEKKKQIKKNHAFWIPKIERNIQKDNLNNNTLINMGFNVLRFSDKQIKSNLQDCLKIVINYIENTNEIRLSV